MLAMRDKEDRCASPATTSPTFKIFVFLHRSGDFAGRAMFTCSRFMSPSFVGIVRPSRCDLRRRRRAHVADRRGLRRLIVNFARQCSPKPSRTLLFLRRLFIAVVCSSPMVWRLYEKYSKPL